MPVCWGGCSEVAVLFDHVVPEAVEAVEVGPTPLLDAAYGFVSCLLLLTKHSLEQYSGMGLPLLLDMTLTMLGQPCLLH